MAQYLALPLNTCIINVGYKQYAPGYNLNGTKATHYGVDFIGSTFASNRGFFASGNGVVLGVNKTFIPKSGYTVGRWIAVKYTDVVNYGSLIVRYYHLERVDVSVGQSISLDTQLGVYGTTGDYSTGNHIHVEVDTDTVNWQYTPTISSATKCGLKPGYTGDRDTTIDPLLVFKRKLSAPEKQTCSVDNDGVWCANITIPDGFH